MLGNILKKLRKEKGITQEELGKILGVTTSMVGMYETNARKPSYEVLLKMADYFGVSTDYLLGKSSELGEGDCKYCKNPSAYLAICQNYETRIFISVSGSYLQIFDEDYPGFCDNHKINFCPMCGRKLS